MATDRIEQMRRAREATSVLLQEYNCLRSRCPDDKIFIFEGYDDLIYYDVMAEKCGINYSFKAMVCKGKPKLLSLRNVLSRNVDFCPENVRYFIDHDFDGFQGHDIGDDVYCTISYSIENDIVSPLALKRLLEGEFRCIGENGLADIESILNLYDRLSDQFLNEMRTANFLIYCHRVQGVKIGPIENSLDKYVKVHLDRVECIADEASTAKLVGLEGVELDKETLENKYGDAFSQLNRESNWRGKYIFEFFKAFLKLLKEDRGARKPKIFKKKERIPLSIDGNIFRTLSVIAPVPDRLRSFLVPTT